MKPEFVRFSLLWVQVCVPADFTDAQVEQFANSEHPTGISSTWQIQRLDPVRADCHERADCVHLVLTC